MGTRRCDPGFATLLAFAACAGIGPAIAGERPAYVPPPKLSTDLPSPAVATGPQFRKALQEVLPGASWKQAILRDVLGQLAESHSLSILRDRRIDPTTAVGVSESNVSLEQLLIGVADAADAEVRSVGNVLYVAPAHSAEVVRTVVALREEELAAGRFRGHAHRQAVLRRDRTVRWADLTTPREALDLVAQQFGLQVENPDVVPHDLWEHAVFADMTAAEMLSLVLIQFDLTFEWGADLQSVRLVPLPQDRSQIVLRRVHRPRLKPDVAIKVWQEALGDVEATSQGNDVIVHARVEQHEAIEELIYGKRNSGTMKPAEPVPLSRRQFTLAVSGVPAKAVMQQLEASGIMFEYDAERLQKAGVDLNQPISMNVREVRADEFLRKLFEPLGLKVRFSGVRVNLEIPESLR